MLFFMRPQDRNFLETKEGYSALTVMEGKYEAIFTSLSKRGETSRWPKTQKQNKEKRYFSIENNKKKNPELDSTLLS